MLRKYSEEDILILSPIISGVCNKEWLESVTILDKTSASNTYQALARVKYDSLGQTIGLLGNTKVFIKVSEYQDALSLPAEVVIYRYLSLIRESGAINFVPKYYMDFSCTFLDSKKEIIDSLSESFKTMAVKSKQALPSSYANHLLVTEQFSKEDGFLSLRDLVGSKNPALTSEEIGNIIFQIEYITSELRRLGLRHNDLHGGNIFVKVSPTPQPLFFYEMVDGEIVEANLTTRFKLHIIDFDLSTPINDSIPINTTTFSFKSRGLIADKSNGCLENGTCDYDLEAFDINFAIGDLYSAILDAENLDPGIMRELEKYLRFKYPKGYSNFISNQVTLYAQRVPNKLCLPDKDYTCDRPDWSVSDPKDPEYIVSHQNIMNSRESVFPHISFSLIERDQIYKKFYSIGQDRACVSVEIENPFTVEPSEIIEKIYYDHISKVKTLY